MEYIIAIISALGVIIAALIGYCGYRKSKSTAKTSGDNSPAIDGNDNLILSENSNLNKLDFRGATIKNMYIYSSETKPSAVEPQDTKPSENDANQRNTIGFEYMKKGDYQRAVTEFNKAIKLNPSWEAYDFRGVAYRSIGETVTDISEKRKYYKLAIKDFSDALKLSPVEYKYIPYKDRGITHYLLSRTTKDTNEVAARYNLSIADYSDAIELNSRDANAYGSRGNVYCEVGAIMADKRKKETFYRLGIADLDKAAKLDRSDVIARWARGLAKYEIGDYKGAKKDLEITAMLAVEQRNEELAIMAQEALSELHRRTKEPPAGE